MSRIKGGRAAATARSSGINNKDTDTLQQKPPTKIKRILQALTEQKLTRFDAERIGDHALNSTISSIGKIGVTVSREPVIVPGRFGPVHCKRYWIDEASRPAAEALLGRLR